MLQGVFRSNIFRGFDKTVSEFNEQWTLLFVTAKGGLPLWLCVFLLLPNILSVFAEQYEWKFPTISEAESSTHVKCWKNVNIKPAGIRKKPILQ